LLTTTRLSGSFGPLVPQGLEGGPEVVLSRRAAPVVPALDGRRQEVGEPGVDVHVPAIWEVILVLHTPGRLADVGDRRLVLTQVVASLVEDWILGEPLGDLMVGPEGVGDLAVPIDPDAEAIDVADGPVAMFDRRGERATPAG
jgi:hypothetical protein